ncbi:MAG: ZPR1 zinc finger domain-containing protein, partial [Candidatus Thermoplasmatota archaeon]|nr:ZPR1 zinc finger domain-containing protein [Candidatus Thermoplasmatota archaeon]
MTEQLPCPICQEKGFTTRMENLDIPYFGEVIEMVYICEACGFRRADLHVVNESDPVRYTVEVTEPEDLSIRVVRSGSGHFEIPELGVRANPAEASDAFVSNVEGVLERCEQ